ncbi:hypothetical protein MNV49_003216 [Pseudohyphozyma bogoriensis]|nr:hypothetical protein MNV49_003216 [Pseudohyphozyma bogoriensis]
MGQSTSTAAPRPTLDEKMNTYSAPATGRRDQSAAELLAALSIRKAPASAAITFDSVAEWDAAFAKDPKNKLASTVLSKQDFLGSAEIADQQVYNVKLSTEGNPVTNQKSSGRCWLFATTNVIRIAMSRKYNLDGFQLSQSYLFFYDSLSKANYFLESMLDLADEDLDSRLIQYLMDAPENDGGQWDMAVNLVETFGLVPQTVYPESFNSSNTSKLDTFLTSKLREYALELRELHSAAMRSLSEVEGKSHEEKKAIAVQSARKRKEEQMEEVYRVLAITLGAPPKPDAPFTWEYYDKAGKYHKVTSTPLDFYKNYAQTNVSQAISLINDPRNKFDELYTVDRLGNVVGGRPVLYVNCEIQKLKDVAIALLKADIPVWFGCDVGKSSNSALGLMDTALYDMEGAFGTKVGLSKAQRLATGDSAMTHAMTLTAVHLDDAGKPVRWRVENSWSDTAGDKGYFLASDAWFTEYVFQIVADRARVPKDLVKIFEENTPVVLPAWDPMGALA